MRRSLGFRAKALHPRLYAAARIRGLKTRQNMGNDKLVSSSHSPFPIPYSPFRIRIEFMKIDHATVAVVTGAASGIGRALAVRLAQEGASLAIADIRAAELNETARRLKSMGGSSSKVTEHIVDVSDKERAAAFARAVVEAP